jgi:hypothetical protein
MLRKGLFSPVGEESLPTYDSDVALGETPFATQAMSVMERPKDNELVELHCMVPLKGGKMCDQILFKRQVNIPTEPPLCPTHEKFAPAFEWNGTEWVRKPNT